MRNFFFQKHTKKLPGQGLVEFALVFPIFLLLILGIIEFGRLMITVSSVYSAAREAARYGSASDYYTDCEGIRAAANRIGFIAGPLDTKIGYVDAADLDSEPLGWLQVLNQCPDFPHTSQEAAAVPRVIVQVTAQFKFLFLSLPEFPITSQSVRTIVLKVAYQGPDDPVDPEDLPVCSFISASLGAPSTISPTYSFDIKTHSTLVSPIITKVRIEWVKTDGRKTSALTGFTYDFGTSSQTLHDTGGSYDFSGLTLPAWGTKNLEFTFSISGNKNFSITNATVFLTYTDPVDPTKSFNCTVNPGQTAQQE